MPKMNTSERRVWFRRSILMALSVIAVVGLAYAAGKLADKSISAKNSESQQTEDSRSAESFIDENTEEKLITVNGKNYRLKDDLETVLIMGVDEAEVQQDSETYLNHNQADFLTVIVIDHSSKSYTSLALNRDTMTKIPTLGLDGEFIEWRDGQLALAHTYGSGLEDSCENTVLAVSEFLFQTPVDHYASLAMPSIGIVNDAVGGVTVTVEDDFGEADPTLVKGETVTLNAEQAEHFVRSRKGVSDQTNLNRMSRQKKYISLWKDKAVQRIKDDSNFVFSLLSVVSEYMVSDMSIDQLSDLANYVAEYKDNGTLETAGESVKGDEFMEYYVDDGDLQEKVLTLFYDEV